MKRNKLFLLPLFMLLLAGCRDVSSSSKPEPSDSIPPIVSSEPSEQESEEPSSEVEEPSSEVEEPSSEPAESSSEEESLPPIVDPEEPTVEETTIAAIRAMTEGWDSVATKDKEQKYEVSGTVTHKFRGAVEKSTGKSLPAWNIAIQDDNGQALLLYALTEDDYAADFADVPIGSLLTVTGHLATYGGLRELDRVEYVSHEEGVAIEPVVLDSIEQSTLVGKDSLLVKIPDLKLKKVTKLEANVDGTFVNITVDITLEKGGHEIGTYMHYNIPIADAEETVALLETVKSTDTITWTGILGINNKTFQLTNASVDEWDITKGEAAVLEGISFSEEEVEVLMEETVELELVADPFDAVIEGATYESADPLVATVDANGVVTGVSAGETVVTATVGELTATIDVVVIDPATLEPSTTVTAEALGLAAYGPVEDVEIDGILWSGTEMGDYGAGIQIRNKDGNDFSLYNTTAFPGKVKTVTLTNFTG
ncbi:MAG TPA: Ig-like domain-containing protein, partial [Bacilli bacterium]|nr:Ig-like domain-containing protein [Bacilli bacterium]